MPSPPEIKELTPEQFERFSRLIHDRAFITLKEHKLTLLSNRLRRRMHALGLDSYDDYYKVVTGKDNEQEMVRFLEVVTTNETYFWRTIQNFAMLKQGILPELLQQFKKQKLRFWSAGCSSGEEPYNLAMELIEAMKKLGPFEYCIRASDLSQRMIEFAREGSYHGRKIEKIPPALLRRYFREESDRPGYYRVRDDIKKKIEFVNENLFEASVGDLHCIFCRNVMIYFSREDQERLIARFYDLLQPGGYLIVGHSESLHMFDTAFSHRQFDDGVAYQKTN